MPGSPIRTPWDHSLVDSSPRPIAASHVLHRLLVPRHPPFALDNLTYRKQRCSRPLCNSQPTTNPQPHPDHTKPWRRRRLPQVVCDPRPCLDSSETTTPRPLKAKPVVLSGPNRVLIAFHQPHQPLFRRRSPLVYSASRPLPKENSPVSPPYEHPTTTDGQCGLLDDFRRRVAP